MKRFEGNVFDFHTQGNWVRKGKEYPSLKEQAGKLIFGDIFPKRFGGDQAL